MTVIEPAAPAGITPGARNTSAGLTVLGGLAGAAIIAWLVAQPGANALLGVDRAADALSLSLLAAGALFLLIGGGVAMRRLFIGGAVALIGVVFWLVGCIVFKSFSWTLAVPVALGLLGSVSGMIAHDRYASQIRDRRLVYRQDGLTRITHWVWAFAMFFLLLSGLQIFNARPNLYIGQQSGFGFENSILDIYAVNTPSGPQGQTKLLGQTYNTSGWLGMSGSATRPAFTAFPAWATIPSYRDLATGRVVHFFFAWVLVGTVAIWLINALFTGHLWRDIVLKPHDLRALPRDIRDHLRLRFSHGRTYTPLQKLAYFGVFVIAFPLIIATGLTMSPGMDTFAPWLTELFGGRQTARTIHFLTMVAFVLFFLVHIVMVVLAGPINELRSMITGYYRTSPHGADTDREAR
jgi:thiosulfate reductase cytochrome b subunit